MKVTINEREYELKELTKEEARAYIGKEVYVWNDANCLAKRKLIEVFIPECGFPFCVLQTDKVSTKLYTHCAPVPEEWYVVDLGKVEKGKRYLTTTVPSNFGVVDYGLKEYCEQKARELNEQKEVTEWNGKPRWMWVWDYDSNHKKKKYVLCILTDEEMKEGEAGFPVCAYDYNFKHCAEIEEEKRPCTREELIELLKKQGVPMLKYIESDSYRSVALMNKSSVCFVESNYYSYSYKELCEKYTLLDGTELWVEE